MSWQLLGLAYCNTLENKKLGAQRLIRDRGCLPGSSAAPRAAQHETRQTPSLRGCPAGQKKGSMAAQAADANEQNEQLRKAVERALAASFVARRAKADVAKDLLNKDRPPTADDIRQALEDGGWAKELRMISASRRVEKPSRRRRDSCPSHHEVI